MYRRIPELGLDNEFFIRMEDDNGAVYDTPEFKLQGRQWLMCV